MLIVGVGPGFGYATAEFFATRARGVAMVSRNIAPLEKLASELSGQNARVVPIACDATNERHVQRMMEAVTTTVGLPDLVIYAVQNSSSEDVLNMEVAAFEESWRSTCLGGFIVGREAARRMRERGSGTIVFTGSTSGLIARPGHLNLAVGKHGLRALTHVMARELWPLGIHVTHCVIDGDIADGTQTMDPQIDPKHVAEAILSIHNQPASCWTSELDMRPARERFWEHC